MMAQPGPRFKSIPVNITAAGDNIVLSVPNNPINIYGLYLVSDTQQYITYKNGATPLSGGLFFTVGGSSNLAPDGFVKYVCGAGTPPNGGFVINLSVGGHVAGTLYYTLGGL